MRGSGRTDRRGGGRRQLLAGLKGRQRDGAHQSRPYGDAGHDHQRPGLGRRAGKGRRHRPGADGHRYEQNRRALCPAEGHPPFGKRPCGDFRLRHGQPFLFNGYGGRSAGGGDRRRRSAAGQKCGRRL